MTISRLAFLIVAAAGFAAAQNVTSIAGPGIPSPCPAESWSFGIKGVVGAGSAGKARVSTLEVIRQVDRCSPKLLEAAATGKHFATVTLTHYDSTGRTEILQVKLTDVIVSSTQIAAQTSSPTLTEYVVFSFAKMEYHYYSSTGPIDASVDLNSNTGF